MTNPEFLDRATRILFFTGKGGVGKTSLACATAIALAERGRKVLLVSTDPASNLDEVLGVRLSGEPTPVPGASGLFALNIDPEAAARAYRERVVGPYRGVLPEAAVNSMEEQLSGACTVEIAAFDEFSKLLGDEHATQAYDHIVFDTAPTGHTLRLLQLPGAWTGFMANNTTGTSCLGPLSGLQAQRSLYESSLRALSDGATTTLVLVSRPEPSALTEADRTAGELARIGVVNRILIVNGLFVASEPDDPIAHALESRGRMAMEGMPAALASLPRLEVPLFGFAPMGIQGLRQVLGERRASSAKFVTLIDEIERAGRGVVMTMGKGGVGKTTIASAIAVELARRGHAVHLSTTDPAGRLANVVAAGLRVSRIDPAAETARYTADVLAKNTPNLDADGRALLEEDLRSPCTEEIAVFSAFARTVSEGQDGFVVLDTAPTGHTLLLLDAAESYHREVARTASDVPEAVRNLLPRLRDAGFTRVLLVTLPEATPVHEAARLQEDLLRAGIKPFAWIVNQSFAGAGLRDPILRERGSREFPFIAEVRDKLASRMVVIPWGGGGTGGRGMNFFERYLSLWVAACMVVGVLMGKLLPGGVDALRKMEFGSGSQINVPIAVLIWLMIIPMMMTVDFTSIRSVGQRPRGLLVTLFVNWLVKPFSMALIGWFFFRVVFAAWISPGEADQYIAGVIILAAAPCTAMVFVWSYLTDGDPAYTLVQVSVNDLIMLVLFAPIVRYLVSGASSLTVPFLVLLYSVVAFIVIPLAIGSIVRAVLIHRHGKTWFEGVLLPRFAPVTILALLATLVFIFAFQADNITGKSFHVVLIAVPILIQVYFNSSLAYGLMRLLKVEYAVAAPGALIGASNFFELAVATAIALFGPGSGAALATVVGVLVEVPVMLTVCAACNRTRHWFSYTAPE